MAQFQKSKKKFSQRTTILIVGEGDTEEAFLKYLRGLLCFQHSDLNRLLNIFEGQLHLTIETSINLGDI